MTVPGASPPEKTRVVAETSTGWRHAADAHTTGTARQTQSQGIRQRMSRRQPPPANEQQPCHNRRQHCTLVGLASFSGANSDRNGAIAMVGQLGRNLETRVPAFLTLPAAHSIVKLLWCTP